MRRLALCSLLATAVVVGCKNPDDDLEPAIVPKVHAFEGTTEPKFVGTWASTDGLSTLDLIKDGTLAIHATVPTPSGKSTSVLKGHWLASDGSLLLKYGKAGQGETVLKYTAAFSDKGLKLKQEGGRMETTYRRK
ncbi:hypothetical protein EON82_01560 [bacterium]|nr:MAG: hypothetical protein EON82_01560 [bacterium]